MSIPSSHVFNGRSASATRTYIPSQRVGNIEENKSDSLVGFIYFTYIYVLFTYEGQFQSSELEADIEGATRRPARYGNTYGEEARSLIRATIEDFGQLA